MHTRRLFLVLGFASTLPSNYFYALFGVCYFLLLASPFRSNVSSKQGMFGFILMCALFAGSTLLGIYFNESEAQLFLFRALFSAFIVLFYFVALDGHDDNAYYSYLLGVFAGIVLNSLAVIAFAYSPEAYEALRIDTFSGFNKGARALRSPGLQSGTDTAGYLAVFGTVLYLYLQQKGIRSWLVSRKFFYLLLLTPLLCSRSSMLLSAGVMLFLLIAWRHKISASDKFVMMTFGALVAVAGIALVGLLLYPELMSSIDYSTELLGGVPVEAVYMVADGDSYVDQYDFSNLFTWVPHGNPELYDNTIGKLLASMGLIGLVSGAIVVCYMTLALLIGSRRREPVLVFVYLAIYLFANAKNNYLFYSFFISMSSVLFCRVAGRMQPLNRASVLS